MTTTGKKNNRNFPLEQQNIDELSQQLVQIASSAAFKVGDMLVEASAKAARGAVSAEEKAGYHDLVTKYDRESERVIVEHIFQQYPNSTVVGEEAGARGSGAIYWYVDPIDGTSNFASGIPLFCVSIGVVLNDRIVAGVIFDPVRGELFSASTKGAFLNDEPIRARGHKIESKVVLFTDFPYGENKMLKDDPVLFARMVERFRAVRRFGSVALELADVACGRAGVVFSVDINPWDVVAGMFLVEQAGGCYVALNGASPSISQQPWLSPGFIAACPEFELEQSILNVVLRQEG